jgi:hypothetical protein
MQPSSDRPSAARGSGGALRRYGPIAAIVAVLAVIGGAVALGGGDDDEDQTATGDTTSETGGAASEGGGEGEGGAADVQRPAGAVSWTQAEEEGLDVTFPDTCDPETGRVAIPYFYAPECFADVADNGGDTARGVTADTITVVYYSAPASDPVLDYITGPIKNDDTPEQIAETVQHFAEIFNSTYQTYGRTVEVKVLDASGGSRDEVAARADARKAVEEMGAFAVWGGPALTNAWADEIAAQGAICIGCLGGSPEFYDDRAPYVVGVGMNGQQNNVHAAEYVTKKLAGKPAEHAGDEAMHDQERVFAHLYISSSEESQKNAEQLAALLGEGGVDLAEQLPYELDPGRLPEQATSVISKLKEAGVTTVLIQADPVAPANFTQEATAQEYFPEWVVAGGTLTDTTVFGRVYDQQQWANAFGITTIAARQSPELTPGFRLHEWFFGEAPPAAETAPVLYPNPSLFFSVLQGAGPGLTAETFRDSLFSAEPRQGALTASSLSWGDHGLWEDIDVDWNGVDDATEFWWDADATGPDELQREGQGMIRYVDGGTRYLPGAWDTELSAFDEAGTVMVYEEAPADETPPDYPSPAG